MILPELFEFLLSTARAAGGMGVVLVGFFIGKWAYSNPQPTWADLWRAMPPTMRGFATVLLGMTLISHVLLTIREFSGSPAPTAGPVTRNIPQPSVQEILIESDSVPRR